MKRLDRELLKNNIEKHAWENISSQKISGASVLVCQDGQIMYKNFFGTTAPNGDISVSADTVYRLMSMTKPITAVAVMILIERGLLTLDTPIEKFLPDFKKQKIVCLDESEKLVTVGEAHTPITVFQLLTHTSGVGSRPVWAKQYGMMSADDKKTLDASVKYFAKAGLAFEPCTAQSYSATAAFAILGKLVELITGEDYNEFLKKNIFEPCEMKDTTFVPSDSQWSRMIKMHDLKNGKALEVHIEKGYVSKDFPCTNYLGGSGLVSTLQDYGNFAEMLLCGGQFKGKRVISEESVKALSSPQISEEIQPGAVRWGLAMRVVVGENRRPVGSYGWSGAYGTHFWVDPANKITAVYLKNSFYDGGSGAKTSAQFEEDVYSSFEK